MSSCKSDYKIHNVMLNTTAKETDTGVTIQADLKLINSVAYCSEKRKSTTGGDSIQFNSIQFNSSIFDSIQFII